MQREVEVWSFNRERCGVISEKYNTTLFLICNYDHSLKNIESFLKGLPEDQPRDMLLMGEVEFDKEESQMSNELVFNSLQNIS